MQVRELREGGGEGLREEKLIKLISFITLFLFAKETPGVRLLRSLHCRMRENNWKNTLHFILTSIVQIFSGILTGM